MRCLRRDHSLLQNVVYHTCTRRTLPLFQSTLLFLLVSSGLHFIVWKFVVDACWHCTHNVQFIHSKRTKITQGNITHTHTHVEVWQPVSAVWDSIVTTLTLTQWLSVSSTLPTHSCDVMCADTEMTCWLTYCMLKKWKKLMHTYTCCYMHIHTCSHREGHCS